MKKSMHSLKRIGSKQDRQEGYETSWLPWSSVRDSVFVWTHEIGKHESEKQSELNDTSDKQNIDSQ